MNETDVIGLSRGVKTVNCQQRQTLIVSSAPSSRQVICRGAGEGGDGGIGEVEKGVFPFFFWQKGGEGMEGGGGGGGYPWGPPDSQHFATPVKQMEGGQRSLHASHPLPAACFTLGILKRDR